MGGCVLGGGNVLEIVVSKVVVVDGRRGEEGNGEGIIGKENSTTLEMAMVVR